MHGNLTGDETQATFANATECSQLQDIADPRWFAHLCHHLSPTKPWLMLMQSCGIKERTAHNYADGTTKPTADVLAALILSAQGYRVLKAMAEPKSPDWWLVIQRERQLAALAQTIFESLNVAINE